MLQRLDLALRHQRVQLHRQTGPRHHFIHCRSNRHRQAHAAAFGPCGNANPATIGNRAIAFGKTGAAPHFAVFQNGGIQITGPLQRVQHLAAQFSRLVQNGLDHIRRCLGELIGRGHLIQTDHMVKQEPEI